MTISYKRVDKDFFQASELDVHLNENYNKDANMPEFAVVAANGIQIGPWMRCKDYIQDVWWGYKHNRQYSIYGFSYDPKIDPMPSTHNLLLAMRWRGKEQQIAGYLENIKKTVWNVETQLKIPKYKRTKFSRPQGNMFIVYGSSKYLGAIKLVSFFTWLLRASFNNVGGKIGTIKNPPVKKDFYYLNTGKIFIAKLFKDGIDSIEGDWDKAEVGLCHNQGFVHASNAIKSDGKKVSDYMTTKDDWGF